MITAAITDLWELREISSFSPGPATASIPVFTQRKLPQVEKNAWSAPTASAIRPWASPSTPWDRRRSSRPFMFSTSDAKTPSPRIFLTRGSAPRP